MTKPQKRLLITAIVFALIWSALSFPPVYFAKPIRGKVVDAVTGKPIEGAVVVAQWILFQGSIGHGGHGPRLKISETVTDKNGNYYISWWGPRLHLPFSYLDSDDPMIVIFKPSYERRALFNHVDRISMIRFSEWDGKTVKMKRFKGTPEEYARSLSTLIIILRHEDTDFQDMPKMVSTLRKEAKKLRTLGVDSAAIAILPRSD